ncbi:hypothetical protein OV208_36665 [Corallococcus sp. bb12-1]|nr:hypothetical protein [Corallococcus sp. bb12-1]MCY1046896.1 hypothetical protein [Corallococcus sp. bb12-1]
MLGDAVSQGTCHGLQSEGVASLEPELAGRLVDSSHASLAVELGVK